MINLSHPEATFARGLHLAPHHGDVVPCVPSTFLDGPSGAKVACPRTIAEWPHVAEGVLCPNIWLPCDEASGNLIDRGDSALTYSAAGAVTYANVRTNWAGSWVGLVASSGVGFRAALETAYDPLSPVFGSLDFQVTSTGGSRTLYSVVNGALIQLNTAGQLQLLVTGSTAVIGTVDYRHATTAYPLVFLWDPTGPTPTLIVATNREQIAVTAGSGFGGVVRIQGDSVKGIGGATSAAVVGFVRHHALWLGQSALIMANRGGTRAGCQRLIADRRWV